MLATCRHQSKSAALRLRTFATEAAAQPSSSLAPPPSGASSKKLKPEISTAVIVNRSPLLTRTPTPLERAYYAYQARLRRAISNPFPSEFYFKQGSILETRFNVEERQREKFNFGPNFRKLDDLEKERIAKEDTMAEQLGKQEGEDEVLMSRVHRADNARDYKSLDRKGRKNLYLLVKTADDVWRFPEGDVKKGELLHQSAQRDLAEECGANMDTWIVSRNPIGVYHPQRQAQPSEGKTLRERVTFFYKAHILAGQAKPQDGVADFAWLTKPEIEARVDKQYWDGVKDILSDY